MFASATRTARRQLRNTAVTASLAFALGAGPFAKNIARAFHRGVANGDIDAHDHTSARGRVYSPVTGRTYSMRCTHLADSTFAEERWGCWGGTSAYTRVTYYS